MSGYICGTLLKNCPVGRSEAARGVVTNSSSEDVEDLPETLPGSEIEGNAYENVSASGEGGAGDGQRGNDEL